MINNNDEHEASNLKLNLSFKELYSIIETSDLTEIIPEDPRSYENSYPEEFDLSDTELLYLYDSIKIDDPEIIIALKIMDDKEYNSGKHNEL